MMPSEIIKVLLHAFLSVTVVMICSADCTVCGPACCPVLQVYLHQLDDTAGSALLPPAIVQILNSKACRSAIMFGDPLLPTECAELLAALKETQLCFSCAHGRPTMAPLIDLAALTKHMVAQPHKADHLPYSMLPANRTSLKQRLKQYAPMMQ